jgi:predicted enzyme related to lactoylglutathione lyase
MNNPSPQWNPYFFVIDCKAATDRAASLGCPLAEDSLDMGRTVVSIFTDPQGGRVRLMQRKPKDQWTVTRPNERRAK